MPELPRMDRLGHVPRAVPPFKETPDTDPSNDRDATEDSRNLRVCGCRHVNTKPREYDDLHQDVRPVSYHITDGHLGGTSP